MSAGYEFKSPPCERAGLLAVGASVVMLDQIGWGRTLFEGIGLWLFCWGVFVLIDKARRWLGIADSAR